jgi:hypothetical protein
LANRLSIALKCDIEELKPRFNLFPVLVLFSLLKSGPGIRKVRHNVNDYENIIICGPIWMGMVIYPISAFIRKYINSINKLHFATCCGSSDAEKSNKFGYATVFPVFQHLLGNKCGLCEAFPIGLVLEPGKEGDGDTIMKTRLTDSNFTGRMSERLDVFIKRLVA